MARDYQTKSNVGALPDTITATRFGAGEFNSIAVELENAVTSSDQTLAPADGTGEVTDQLAMAIAIYGAGGAFYHADTGAVNAYVLTPISPKQSPPAYFDGFTVIFEPGTANTTASTVNVNSLGVKSITYANGGALLGGELSGSCGIKYNLSDDRFELLFASGGLAGIGASYVVDSTQADQGAASANPDSMTIFDVATLVGTSKNATVRLIHNPVAGNTTQFLFDTSLDLSAYPNLKFEIDNGARLTRTTGDEIFTLYSPENIIASKRQQITSIDILRFASPGAVQSDWWGTDANAFQYAGNSILTNGGTMKINAGTYDDLGAQLAWTTSARFEIEGEGRGLTILNWTDSATSGGGISLSYNDYLEPPTIHGFTLQTKAFDTGTGLYVQGVDVPFGATIIGPRIYDLSVKGYDISTDCWDKGISVSAAWFLELHHFDIKGLDDSTTPFDQAVGVEIESCQAVFIHDFTIFHTDIGIVETYDGITYRGEGINIHTFEIVGVTYGIALAATNAAAGTNIGPGHINAYINCIAATARHQMTIHDMLLYKTNLSTSDFIGIAMVDCYDDKIHHNIFRGDPAATGNCAGIQLSGTPGCDRNEIDNNKFFDFYGSNLYGIVIGSNADENYIHDNVAPDGTVTSIVVVSGGLLGNNLYNNFPAVYGSFADGDTTPSIANSSTLMFLTSNTGATSITALDDGIEIGQKVYVLVLDANTTFVHSGTLVMKNSVNYAAAVNDILTFQHWGSGSWREISRLP